MGSGMALIDSKDDLFILAISTVGFIYLFTRIYKCLKWGWCMFVRNPKNLLQYGSWAAITGCTDGIGKALTFELASKGLDLVLIGRNITKLETLSSEIKKRYGDRIKMRIIVIDFAKLSGEEIERQIKDGIEELDIGILINNVGMANPYPKFFHELDLDLLQGMLKVNVDGMIWATRAVLASMIRKRKGVVVNIGSGSSVVVPAYPLFSIYAATKAYIAMFSKSLSLEYQQYGIDIQCQVPLFVATKMTSIRKSSLFIPSPEEYSKASISWIGHDKFCVPYGPHALQSVLMNFVPDSLLLWILFRIFLTIREKVLRKDSTKSKSRHAVTPRVS